MNPTKLTHNQTQELEPQALANFKKLVLNVAHKYSKHMSFVDRQAPVLEKYLDEFLPRLSIPNHPPYHFMIEKAIQQLDGEQAPSKEAISTFLKKTYVDLPFFHDALLENHLDELCRKGEVIKSFDDAYSIDSKRKRSTIVNSFPKMTTSKPNITHCGNEWIPSSSSNPFCDNKLLIEGNMESDKKENGRGKPIGRTRSSIKRLGAPSK